MWIYILWRQMSVCNVHESVLVSKYAQLMESYILAYCAIPFLYQSTSSRKKCIAT